MNARDYFRVEICTFEEFNWGRNNGTEDTICQERSSHSSSVPIANLVRPAHNPAKPWASRVKRGWFVVGQVSVKPFRKKKRR